MQARQPEAQRRSTQQRRPDFPFHGRKRPLAGIGAHRCCHPLRVQSPVFHSAPVVDGDGQIEQQHIVASVVEVDDTRDAIALEQHVVAEQIAVDDPARQVEITQARLVIQLLRQQPLAGWIQMRQQHLRHALPPLGSAAVGSLAGVALPGQVQTGQHFAHRGALVGIRLQGAASRQALHQRGGLALEHQQDLAVAIRHRRRAGDAVGIQVIHQVETEWQLADMQGFEQRQHPAPTAGIDKVVGVFDAGADALEMLQIAHGIGIEEGDQLAAFNLGENRHETPKSGRGSGKLSARRSIG